MTGCSLCQRSSNIPGMLLPQSPAIPSGNVSAVPRVHQTVNIRLWLPAFLVKQPITSGFHHSHPWHFHNITKILDFTPKMCRHSTRRVLYRRSQQRKSSKKKGIINLFCSSLTPGLQEAIKYVQFWGWPGLDGFWTDLNFYSTSQFIPGCIKEIYTALVARKVVWLGHVRNLGRIIHIIIFFA